jgi:regulator of cell morphogenesis and NO signaling
MKIEETQIVGELVAIDYRTANVFKKLGIDFCCKGNTTIKEVCNKRQIEPEVVIAKLEQAMQNGEDTIDYQQWPIDLLADYIEKTHHRYVQDKIIEIVPYLIKICQVHGSRHNELEKIKAEFLDSAAELTTHMKKEELILFPYIRRMVKAKRDGVEIDDAYFGSVKNPILMMMAEHETEGERYRKIAELSGNYNPPVDACNTYKVCYALLKEFETDLHLHIHLENNILFPKAIEIEKLIN